MIQARESPLVTVVIPVFNGRELVSSAIESVLAQSFTDFELIIADDGSTDGTLGVLTKYKSRAKIYPLAHKGTASAGRNIGHRIGQGRWVAYLDHDDIWKPDRLARCIEIVERFPATRVVFSDFVRFEWSTGIRHPLRHSELSHSILKWLDPLRSVSENAWKLSKEEAFHLLVSGYWIAPSAAMVSRDLVDEIGLWREDIRNGEDADFFMRCSTCGDFVYVHEVLTELGRHESNISADLIQQQERAVQSMVNHLGSPLFNSHQKTKISARIHEEYCGLAYNFAARNQLAKARAYYVKAMLHPKTVLHAVSRYIFTLPLIRPIYVNLQKAKDRAPR